MCFIKYKFSLHVCDYGPLFQSPIFRSSTIALTLLTISLILLTVTLLTLTFGKVDVRNSGPLPNKLMHAVCFRLLGRNIPLLNVLEIYTSFTIGCDTVSMQILIARIMHMNTIIIHKIVINHSRKPSVIYSASNYEL